MQSKRKYPKKRPPYAAFFLRASIFPGVAGRDAPYPSSNMRHPCRILYALGCFGLFPAKFPVFMPSGYSARHKGMGANRSKHELNSGCRYRSGDRSYFFRDECRMQKSLNPLHVRMDAFFIKIKSV
jgi:hypothetical protein